MQFASSFEAAEQFLDTNTDHPRAFIQLPLPAALAWIDTYMQLAVPYFAHIALARAARVPIDTFALSSASDTTSNTVMPYLIMEYYLLMSYKQKIKKLMKFLQLSTSRILFAFT